MGTAVRQSFPTGRRDDMGVGVPPERGVSERRGEGGEGSGVAAAVRDKGIPASYGGEGWMARRVEDVPRRCSVLFCLP